MPSTGLLAVSMTERRQAIASVALAMRGKRLGLTDAGGTMRPNELEPSLQAA